MDVLIADDEPISRILTRSVLEKDGHEVTEAGDGREAFAELQKKHHPIVVSDWLMPDVSGLELCRMVRARNTPPYTYIILLTTLEGRGRCLEALEAGADDFLSKPLDAEHLVARVRVAERVMGLRARLTHLEDILAVCMHCKRIRGDDSLWMQVETYVEKRLERPLSHSLCPECYARELARLKVTKP